jgi:molybdopterin-guanine dinucleotide biosynthesis protein A
MREADRSMNGPEEGISALILAGGRSTRMGQDKAWLQFGGVPLVEHTARRVSPLVDELIFSTDQPIPFEPLLRRLPLPVQVVSDETPGAGPLAGIAAGLGAATFDLVLVLAVDMPFVQLRLLSHMATLAVDYEAVVPGMRHSTSDELVAEPLHAFYRRSCLAPISAHLQAGHRRVVSFLPDVRTCWISAAEIARFDPDFMSFHNLNTPADWDLATRWLAAI